MTSAGEPPSVPDPGTTAEPARPTRLGRRGVPSPAEPVADSGPAPVEDRTTRLSGRPGPVVRATTARTAAPASGWPTPGPRGLTTRRRRGGSFVGAAAFAVLAVLVLLFAGRSPLHVTGASVAPAVDPNGSCDSTVDVVGSISTNGRPGTLTYRWLRSDGETSAELTQPVAEGATSTQVHLMWTFSGTGRYPASATIRVLRPDPVDAVGHFTYSCPADPRRPR